MTKMICAGAIAGSVLLLSGCADGTLEIKTKTNNPPNTVIVEKEKPVIVEKEKKVIIDRHDHDRSKETTKSTVTTPDGTTRTKETTTVK